MDASICCYIENAKIKGHKVILLYSTHKMKEYIFQIKHQHFKIFEPNNVLHEMMHYNAVIIPQNKPMNHSPETFEQFLRLDLRAPVTTVDVLAVLSQLDEKKVRDSPHGLLFWGIPN